SRGRAPEARAATLLRGRHRAMSTRRGRGALHATALMLVLLLAFALGACSSHGTFIDPPELMGNPVRIEDAAGARLYFLTSQWTRREFRHNSTRTSGYRKSWSRMYVDLWALDAATTQPLFRRRIKE